MGNNKKISSPDIAKYKCNHEESVQKR